MKNNKSRELGNTEVKSSAKPSPNIPLNPKIEVSILKLEHKSKPLWKVTRKYVLEGVSDTIFTENKRKALKQYREWSLK